MNVQQRVDNGINLLNEKLGPDWYKKIDVSELNVMFNHRCIVGQLFDGYYSIGIKKLDLFNSVADQVIHGFEIQRGLSGTQFRTDAADLNEEWVLRILELRETA